MSVQTTSVLLPGICRYSCCVGSNFHI